MKRISLATLFLASTIVYGSSPIQTVGVGIKTSQRPYKGAGNREMVVPLTNLRYKRVYNQGYQVGFDLCQGEDFSFSTFIEPRIGFEVDGEDLSEGYNKIENRDEQVVGGLKATLREGKDTYTTLSYAWGEEGGGVGNVSIHRPIDITYRWAVIPSITGSYYSQSFSKYYFGVSSEEALSNTQINAAYTPDDSFSYGAALTSEFAATDEWTLVGFVGIERFSGDIEKSPIVGNRTIFTGGIGARYTFY